MWLLLACGSAFFAAVTAVLAKQGVRTTDPTPRTPRWPQPSGRSWSWPGRGAWSSSSALTVR
ncbi:hypothetical protein [Actinomyces sp. 2119]|uniref:hypothetical protein n=1 Tax=Actinomyces sp. 2119 TaxID=2321393 RepID=UPI002175A12E|nr:hypothetical protein [Actinomyces sp. 2119]